MLSSDSLEDDGEPGGVPGSALASRRARSLARCLRRLSFAFLAIFASSFCLRAKYVLRLSNSLPIIPGLSSALSSDSDELEADCSATLRPASKRRLRSFALCLRRCSFFFFADFLRTLFLRLR